MLYLLLFILSATSLTFVFKLFHKYQVPVSQAIFVNYVTCLVLGAIFLPGAAATLIGQGFGAPWLWAAMAAGTLFFVSFYLLSESIKAAGVAITSVAQKVSLVVPVAASLLLWRAEPLQALQLAGLLLALPAVIMASWRKQPGKDQKQTSRKHSLWARLLPLVVFLNAGLADTLFNFANYRYLNPELESAFTLAVFGTAALLGLGVQVYQMAVKHRKFKLKSLAGGVVLGVPNLLSLLFLLKTLTAFDNNGALVFPVGNMSMILLTALGGVLFFKEKLLKLNWSGLGLAVLALALLVTAHLR